LTIWKIQLNKRRLHQKQFLIANEQYHRRVLSRVLLSLKTNYLFIFYFFVKFYHAWKINTYQRQQELEKRLRANYHYRIHLQRICFNGWLTYTEYRRRKNIHKSKENNFDFEIFN